ncbi:MAG: hypothetical protein J6Y75_02305 [Spirochaetaceae bacterium]|nr:hypothetical protein [Spirochaetaceae bacterium]MBP5328712.1 hypothetical protein [Spirochaetaceae bacterium]
MFFSTKKIKFLSLLFCLLFLFAIPAQRVYSFELDCDYGLRLDTNDAMSDLYSYQRRLSPWLTIKFPVLNGVQFDAQASGYIRYNPKSDIFRPLFDVDVFRVMTAVPFLNGRTTFELGRIHMQDTRGMVINQAVDGLGMHITLPRMLMDLYAVYTGWTNHFTTNTLLSSDDIADASNKKDRYYAFGARRLVLEHTVYFPQFFGRADVYGDMIANVDLRKKIQEWKWTKKFAKQTEVKEEVHSIYLGSGIMGPFAKSNNVYYHLGGVIEYLFRQTPKKAEGYISGYFDGGIKWMIDPTMQLSSRVQWGPKNKEGQSEYRPITYKSAGILYEGSFNGLLKPELEFKWKFKPKWVFNTGIYSYLTPKPVKTGFTRASFESIYKYTEFLIGTNGVVAGDVQLTGEFVYGQDSHRANRHRDFALRLNCQVGF